MIYGRRTSAGRHGDWIMVSPPMIISRVECDQMMHRLTATLAEFESSVRATGLLR
jgi:4-aminobutyrate aminotransferase-like enzyme